MLRIFFDTEFTHLTDQLGQLPPDLLSAGFVADTGATWYAERRDANYPGCSAFVRETVLPQFDAPLNARLTRAEFGARLMDWLTAFDCPLLLISSAAEDTELIQGVLADLLPDAPHPLTWQRWFPPAANALADAVPRARLRAAFWAKNPRRPHHALADALWLQAQFNADLRPSAAVKGA